MAEAKKTPFYEKHQSLNGKVIDYNGWLLPVHYQQGLVKEVHQTRNKATLFDVSHMGEIIVEGSDAEKILQKMVTNDVGKLQDNAIIYSPVCYPEGGVVDDILIYRLSSTRFFLVVNAANTDKDYDWFQQNSEGRVTIYNRSYEYAQLALQGPDSEAILQQLVDFPLANMKYYHFEPELKLAGSLTVLVSRTGYTGEEGFEIYCAVNDASKLWDNLWDAGQKHELAPAGLGARDVLRLEASLPLYGHELSRDITPLQAGLHRFVSFNKQVSFNGCDALLQQKEQGLPNKLYGLEMLERGVPREGYRVIGDGADLGWISSGSYSPTLEKSLAMAFLDPRKAAEAKELQVQIRNRLYKVGITKMPFYRR